MVIHDSISTFKNQQCQLLYIFQINIECFCWHTFMHNPTLPDNFLVGNQPELHVSGIIIPVISSNQSGKRVSLSAKIDQISTNRMSTDSSFILYTINLKRSFEY